MRINEDSPREKRLVIRDERGFALVSVIVIALLISLITSALVILSRGFANDSSIFKSSIDGRAAAEAGLNRIILAFSRSGDPIRELLVPDSRPVDWEFHGKTLLLRAQAESGKLDLNA